MSFRDWACLGSDVSSVQTASMSEGQRTSLVTHLYALDLPDALVAWVTMLIVTRVGDRRCNFRPSATLTASNRPASMTKAVLTLQAPLKKFIDACKPATS